MCDIAEGGIELITFFNKKIINLFGSLGKFEFEIDGVKKIVEAGDGVYIEPNLLHSAVCLKQGMLIDTFSPVREDFLSGDGVSYFGDKDK